jgi:cation transport ATPase
MIEKQIDQKQINQKQIDQKQINQKQINQTKIKCNNCMISSFIFVTNIIVAYYYKYYVYGSLFAALIISSLVFHSNPQYIYTNLIDKIIILAIFIYGGYIFITKQNKTIKNRHIQIAIIFSFLTTIYLYYYGYVYNKYCYDNNKEIANKYHSLLHMIGSIGHVFIIIM